MDTQTEFERRKEEFLKYLHSKEYQERLMTRLQVNDACARKPEARGITWNLCARPDNPVEGCMFFIENFGWSFDPRPEHSPHHLPFILFPYQRDVIRWLIDHIDNGKDGLVEKSRDMGISWIIFVWVLIWYWLFRDGVNLLVGSYKQDLVDNRTKDSLMGMVDYGIDNLPKWILPKGFNKLKHRTQMKLVNPANNNLITGDTMNPDFGRGTRKTAILYDELGSWDYAKDAWESGGDATSCRIANSTPKGYNFFAMLRESGIDIITLHWKLHPFKDQKWYEFECARRTPEEVAQELDISYSKSQEGRVYGEWNETNVEKGNFEYNDNLPLYVGWDFGKTDDTAIIWVQPHRGKMRIVDTYRNNNKNIDFYVPFVTGIVPSDGYAYTRSDMEMIAEHRHWKKGTHFGDPAGRFRNAISNETVMSVLNSHGIRINFSNLWNEFEVRKSAAKYLILKGIELNVNDRTKYFDVCMLNASYPSVKNEGIKMVRSADPKHDYTSHYRSAFEYLALGLQDMTGRRESPFDKFKKEERYSKRKVVGY